MFRIIKGFNNGVKKYFKENKNSLFFLGFLAPLVMGAAGAIKGGLSARSANKEAEKRNKARAMGIKFSPWTGYKAGEKAGGVDTMGAVLGGGMTGAQAGMGMNRAFNTPAPSYSGSGYSLGGSSQFQDVDPNLTAKLKSLGII